MVNNAISRNLLRTGTIGEKLVDMYNDNNLRLEERELAKEALLSVGALYRKLESRIES